MQQHDEIIEEIFKRLEKLEEMVFVKNVVKPNKGNKVLSLPEVTRRKGLKNGQEKITAIVGYAEKIRGIDSVSVNDIKQGWREAKFDGGFAPILIVRAVKAGLISTYGNKGTYVLTQTGEDFWDNLLI